WVSYSSQFCWGIEKKASQLSKADMWHGQLSWVRAWLVWQPLGICRNVAMTPRLLTARALRLLHRGAMLAGYLRLKPLRWQKAACGDRPHLCRDTQMLPY